jgi:hypothetical protein
MNQYSKGDYFDLRGLKPHEYYTLCGYLMSQGYDVFSPNYHADTDRAIYGYMVLAYGKQWTSCSSGNHKMIKQRCVPHLVVTINQHSLNSSV